VRAETQRGSWSIVQAYDPTDYFGLNVLRNNNRALAPTMSDRTRYRDCIELDALVQDWGATGSTVIWIGSYLFDPAFGDLLLHCFAHDCR
jgi:hypothetical protein